MTDTRVTDLLLMSSFYREVAGEVVKPVIESYTALWHTAGASRGF